MDETNDLNAARGIVWGCTHSIAFWLVVGFVWWVLWRLKS